MDPMSEEQIAEQTEAIREAKAETQRLSDNTERLIALVEQRAEAAGGAAGAEQAAGQIAQAAMDARKAAQQVVLRFMAGVAIFVAIGLLTPPQSLARLVFVAWSGLMAAWLLAASAPRPPRRTTKSDQRSD